MHILSTIFNTIYQKFILKNVNLKKNVHHKLLPLAINLTTAALAFQDREQSSYLSEFRWGALASPIIIIIASWPCQSVL